MKLTFLSFDEQFVLQQSLEHLPDMLDMFLQGSGEYQDVVKVDRKQTSWENLGGRWSDLKV